MRPVADYRTRLPVLLVVAVLLVSTVPATVAFALIAESEPNDTRETATAITVGETVEGDITADDYDWFTFDDVAAGRSVEMTATVPTVRTACGSTSTTPAGATTAATSLPARPSTSV